MRVLRSSQHAFWRRGFPGRFGSRAVHPHLHLAGTSVHPGHAVYSWRRWGKLPWARRFELFRGPGRIWDWGVM